MDGGDGRKEWVEAFLMHELKKQFIKPHSCLCKEDPSTKQNEKISLLKTK